MSQNNILTEKSNHYFSAIRCEHNVSIQNNLAYYRVQYKITIISFEERKLNIYPDKDNINKIRYKKYTKDKMINYLLNIITIFIEIKSKYFFLFLTIEIDIIVINTVCYKILHCVRFNVH